jgi:nucleoside-diphosphate-sugar epimerase
MKNISILGLGNISIELCHSLKKKGFNVFGSTDNFDRQKALKKIGIKIFSRNELNECILKADKIIITIPPDANGCPVIRHFSKEILEANIKWIGYLSSTSVYGNHNGKVVNENSLLKPKEDVAKSRIQGEKDILELGTNYSIAVEVFRISGIYGKDRNIINQILSKKVKPLYKKGHFFNRIHEEDIARVLTKACSNKMNSGIVNLSDDLPASQLDVIRHAFSIMNIQMPKYENYNDICSKTPLRVRRFWENNRRVDNTLLKKRYGNLLHPTYKEGLSYIYNNYLLNSLNKD